MRSLTLSCGGAAILMNLILRTFGIDISSRRRKVQFAITDHEQLSGLNCCPYCPVDDCLMQDFEVQGASERFRSLKAAIVMKVAGKYFWPIRFMYHNALHHALVGHGSAPPSSRLEEATKFHIEMMNAALAQTATDLIVLGNFGSFQIRCAEQSPNQYAELESWVLDENIQSLQRYAAHLLLKRIRTAPEADFIAFKWAMTLMDEHFFIGKENSDKQCPITLNPLMLDCFPTLLERENEILDRSQELLYRDETGCNPDLIPEYGIGLTVEI